MDVKIEQGWKEVLADEFKKDYDNGYYKDIKICKPLRTLLEFLDKFNKQRNELLEMFNYKLRDLENPVLWKKD